MRRLRPRVWLTLSLGALLMLSVGCLAVPTVEPTLLAENSPTPSTTPIISQVAGEPENTPTPTLDPMKIVYAEVTATYINLRDGPGTTFAAITQLEMGTQATVLYRAMGDEWVFIETPGKQAGWVAIDFIRLIGNMEDLPLKELSNAWLVGGRVVDNTGIPMPGVLVSVHQRISGMDVRTDARTNQNGIFIAYLPDQASGVWTAEITGADCTSPVVDAQCQVNGSFAESKRTFTLPLGDPLEFTFNPAP